MKHYVNSNNLQPPFPDNCETLLLGMGCFWGAERALWRLSGVFVTAVGYAGGDTENPDYKSVCSGSTHHTEVVLVAFDPQIISVEQLLMQFWQMHDPTQGMRQGHDRGSQYRSAIYVTTEKQMEKALLSKEKYQQQLAAQGFGSITTEIARDIKFYYAEDYHQQYLAKIPDGYCGLKGTGVSCVL